MELVYSWLKDYVDVDPTQLKVEIELNFNFKYINVIISDIAGQKFAYTYIEGK